MTSRATLVALLVLLAGCGERTDIAPVPATSSRAPVAEEPSPLIVQPHLRRTEGARTEPSRRPSSGGGGGGGADWTPRREPEPSARDVEAFRRQLEREMAARVDAEEDPCDQFLDVMRATTEATGRRGDHAPDMPSRADMRENCRELPQAYRECLSPEYFREHIEECNEQMARMARRGEREREQARRRFDEMRSGRAPWPGQRSARPSDDERQDEEPEDG